MSAKRSKIAKDHPSGSVSRQLLGHVSFPLGVASVCLWDVGEVTWLVGSYKRNS